METEIEGRPRFDAEAVRLLDRMRELGFDVFWRREFRSYEIIEREIMACDFLLAIVDMTWTGSAWMASEVTWANGDGGALRLGVNDER